MSISTPPTGAIDQRVRRVTLDHWDDYTDAAVKMYTEEIGVSPVQGNPAGYRFYVRQLITSGRAFGIFDRDRVIFKADLGSVSGSVCQVQGVWLDPALDEESIAWARETAAALEPWSLGGGYVNYMQADEPVERVRAAFGAEAFERLQALKRRYDPGNVLRRNQNIPPS